MDAATSLTTAEQALRDVITAVMHREHGADWMDKVVSSELRTQWQTVRQQEAKQRAGHMLGGVTDLSYAFLGDLMNIIKAKGHWARLFEPIFGPKDAAFALLGLLERVRRPIDHARPLLPFEEDLASGIAGYIRNRVTIYLSDQDPDGDYYPRIDRVEDSFGNSFTYTPATDLHGPLSIDTNVTLTVGDTVSFRCDGTDPQGRSLRWMLRLHNGGETVEAVGSSAELSWTPTPFNTGRIQLLLRMCHEGESPYHRNTMGHPGADAVMIIYYQVVPPRA